MDEVRSGSTGKRCCDRQGSAEEDGESSDEGHG